MVTKVDALIIRVGDLIIAKKNYRGSIFNCIFIVGSVDAHDRIITPQSGTCFEYVNNTRIHRVVFDWSNYEFYLPDAEIIEKYNNYKLP